MNQLAYILIVCGGAIGTDWALYNGARTSVEYFRKVPDATTYRSSAFPRIYAVVLSGLIVGFATSRSEVDLPLALFGFAVFLASSGYAQAGIVRQSRRD